MGNETGYRLTDYLQGKVALTITDETLASIYFEREVDADSLATDVTEKQRDLCLADLYMYCAALPTSTGTVDDKNGNWEHKEGSATLSSADKKHYRLLARRLYQKWGEMTESFSSIKVNNGGMSMHRRRNS